MPEHGQNRETTVGQRHDTGDITLALAGDTMPARRLRPHDEPGFLAVAGLLRAADAAVTNSETLYHDYEGTPLPDAGPYGTYAACPPEVAGDVRWLGFDLVSTANNHCMDYGERGLLTSLGHLERHGLATAGAGRSLGEAVSPRFLTTAHGTVALVAVTLTLPPGGQRAGEPRGPVRGRPGPNVLRHRTAHHVPREVFDTLAGLEGPLRLGRGMRRSGDTLRLLGTDFTVGDGYATHHTLDPDDLALNLNAIAGAGRLADLVVVSLHNHEAGAGRDQPSDAAVEFAHRAVDAGADVVFGHGPHLDRGIELYRGRPILYALGNFILQNEVIAHQPWDFARRVGLGPEAGTADLYAAREARSPGGIAHDPLGMTSAVVTVRCRAGVPAELRLHPVDLGVAERERHRTGRPLLAGDDIARQVLDRFRRLSAPYGTDVRIEEGERPVGVVDITAAEPGGPGPAPSAAPGHPAAPVPPARPV